MTALAQDRARASTPDVQARRLSLPVAASTTIYQGALVALNLSGYAVPASADPSLTVVGVAEANVTNTTAAGYGSAGALQVSVQRGTFAFTNSSSTAAITEADIGRVVYAADDATVSRTNPIGALPAVGRVVEMEGSSVMVEVGLLNRGQDGVLDLLIVAGEDLSTTGQYRFVALNSSGAVVLAATAGMIGLGVLLNAPASGAVAIVRRRGLVRVVFSAAVAENVLVAVTASTGKAKAAVTTKCDASGSSATAALTGSFCMGMTLEESTGDDDLALIDLHPSGALPGTLA